MEMLLLSTSLLERFNRTFPKMKQFRLLEVAVQCVAYGLGEYVSRRATGFSSSFRQALSPQATNLKAANDNVPLAANDNPFTISRLNPFARQAGNTALDLQKEVAFAVRPAHTRVPHGFY